MKTATRNTTIALAAMAMIALGQTGAALAMGDANGNRHAKAQASSSSLTEAAGGQQAVVKDAAFSDAPGTGWSDLDENDDWAAKALELRERRGR